jgi:hypothetical protein
MNRKEIRDWDLVFRLEWGRLEGHNHIYLVNALSCECIVLS